MRPDEGGEEPRQHHTDGEGKQHTRMNIKKDANVRKTTGGHEKIRKSEKKRQREITTGWLA